MRLQSNAFKKQWQWLRRETLQEVRDLFLPWLDLPADFGQGAYTRLFSPLTDLLAFPGAGHGRCAMPASQ